MTVKPSNWKKSIQELQGGYKNQELMVWMRPASAPTFRKLHRRVDHDDKSSVTFRLGLPDGQYRLSVNYNYPVSGFGGTKKVLLVNSSLWGGRSFFLGGACTGVGVLSLALAVVLALIHHTYAKKINLQRYMELYREKALNFNPETNPISRRSAMLTGNQSSVSVLRWLNDVPASRGSPHARQWPATPEPVPSDLVTPPKRTVSWNTPELTPEVAAKAQHDQVMSQQAVTNAASASSPARPARPSSDVDERPRKRSFDLMFKRRKSDRGSPQIIVTPPSVRKGRPRQKSRSPQQGEKVHSPSKAKKESPQKNRFTKVSSKTDVEDQRKRKEHNISKGNFKNQEKTHSPKKSEQSPLPKKIDQLLSPMKKSRAGTK